MAPGAEPMIEKGTATMHTILGGRFLQIDVEGGFMGMPFASMTVLGFDRRHELWTSVGFDTFGTYWASARGPRGDDGIVRMDGTDDDPAGEQVYTYVLQFVSDDEFIFAVDFTSIGPMAFDEPFRMVSSRYTRTGKNAAR